MVDFTENIFTKIVEVGWNNIWRSASTVEIVVYPEINKKSILVKHLIETPPVEKSVNHLTITRLNDGYVFTHPDLHYSHGITPSSEYFSYFVAFGVPINDPISLYTNFVDGDITEITGKYIN